MPRFLTFHLADYPGGEVQAAHAHDELHLSLVLRGAVQEQLGWTEQQGTPLSIVVKDPGVRHADRFGARGATMARLSIAAPLGALLDDARRIDGWRWWHRPVLARPFLRLVRRGVAGERRFDVDDDDVVALVAAISAREAAQRGAPPGWLRSVVERLEQDESVPRTTAEVARQARVHPVYLARCLSRWYGESTRAMLQARRLRDAAETLTQGSPTVSVVAQRAGYADEPHLHRTFGRELGLTPRAFRELAAGRASGPLPGGATPVTGVRTTPRRG